MHHRFVFNTQKKHWLDPTIIQIPNKKIMRIVLSSQSYKWRLLSLMCMVVVSQIACSPKEKTPPSTALTSVENTGASEEIEISTRDVSSLQIKTLITGLPITGNLRANKAAFIKARVAGELMDMNLREGDVVQAGQILGRIDPIEYQRRFKQAQETADAAKAQIDIAQRQYDNNKALVNQGFISKTALESSLSNLQTSQATFRAAQAGADVASKALEDSVLKAPFSGQISARFAQSGERMGVDAKILELLDVSKFEVEMTVSALDSVGLKVGQEATLRIEGSNQTLKANLARINPSAQSGSRSVLAYLLLKNTEGLRQGLFVQGTLNLSKQNVLCIPSKDIQNYKAEPFIQIIENGLIKHQTIQTGISGYLDTEDNETKWTQIIGVPENTNVLKSHLGIVRENVHVRFTQMPQTH